MADKQTGTTLRLCLFCLAVVFQVACLGFGAGGRNRTRDPLITSQVLYQLSYTGKKRRIMPMLCVFGKRVQQKMGETWFFSNLDRG